MFELKWTDQDMIDFANSCSGEYIVGDDELSDFTEGRRLEAIQRRVNKLVGMIAIDETLLDKLEKVIKEGTE
jgi:hypothetical protein